MIIIWTVFGSLNSTFLSAQNLSVLNGMNEWLALLIAVLGGAAVGLIQGFFFAQEPEGRRTGLTRARPDPDEGL
ncbi:hypothetical protein [Streptomyces sp. NBC_00304]|uniref:hypothetical protein n=1 Tax=Streptomyces sp. NBC_00304 TaxID=2975706 RepID=UPI003FA74A14